jgi:hypothetical protein
VIDRRAPDCFLPVGGEHKIVRSELIDQITTDEVYIATREVLTRVRTEALFVN